METKSRRIPPKSRREAEKVRTRQIVDEMASAVRLLGGEGPALTQINRAASATRLGVSVIERLRWRKIKRIPADIADTVREAVERHNEEGLARARHEIFIERQKSKYLAARLREIDPDFHGPEIDRLERMGAGDGITDDRGGK